LTDNFESCLDQLFLSARMHNAWRERGVPDVLLHHIVDLAKLGPTSANCSPACFLFVKSRAAKERLEPYLSEVNRDKTMKAPVCATISRILRRHQRQIEFPLQSRLWRWQRSFPRSPRFEFDEMARIL